MKELNLTRGEWEIERNHIFSRPPRGRVGIANIVKYREEYKDQQRANAQAIVTAVNNTYHKGIDPEAVEDMKEALKEAYRTLHTMKDDSWTQELCNMRDLVKEKLNNDPLLNKIENALQKAGIPLNEKAE